MNSKAGFSAIECRRQDSFNRAVSGFARHCGCLRQLLVLPFAQAQATHAADRVDGLPWGWGLAPSFPPENASKIRVHFSISLNRKNSESRLSSTALTIILSSLVLCVGFVRIHKVIRVSPCTPGFRSVITPSSIPPPVTDWTPSPLRSPTESTT